GLGVVCVARTLGPVYDYRLGWIWVVTIFAFDPCVWGPWRRWGGRGGSRVERALGGVCVIALCAITVVNSVDAKNAGERIGGYWPQIATLARQTTAALPRGSGEVILRCGRDEGC